MLNAKHRLEAVIVFNNTLLVTPARPRSVHLWPLWEIFLRQTSRYILIFQWSERLNPYVASGLSGIASFRTEGLFYFC